MNVFETLAVESKIAKAVSSNKSKEDRFNARMSAYLMPSEDITAFFEEAQEEFEVGMLRYEMSHKRPSFDSDFAE